VLNLKRWLRPGKNTLTLAGEHEKPVYVKIARYTGGGFEGVVAKRKFAGPGSEEKSEPLRFEVEGVAAPPQR
jgi:hypothetical protein